MRKDGSQLGKIYRWLGRDRIAHTAARLGSSFGCIKKNPMELTAQLDVHR